MNEFSREVFNQGKGKVKEDRNQGQKSYMSLKTASIHPLAISSILPSLPFLPFPFQGFKNHHLAHILLHCILQSPFHPQSTHFHLFLILLSAPFTGGRPPTHSDAPKSTSEPRIGTE